MHLSSVIQQKSRKIYVLLPALLLSIVFSLWGGIQSAQADAIPGGNVSDPIVRAVDIAEPAVVRIITQASGQIVLNFNANSAVTFPTSGEPYKMSFSGSGTFISSKGDVLTADHVINPQEAFLEAAAPDISAYLASHPELQLGSPSPEEVHARLQNEQLQYQIKEQTRESVIYYSTHYTGPLTATSMSKIPNTLWAKVDQIKKESPLKDRDSAIVHGTFSTDTPFVQLGDATQVQQQDTLTTIGFPGNADVTSNPSDLLTTSVNKVFVSSIKGNGNGSSLIQISGNVEAGNSGGPALDSQGSIVGIVSFGLSSTSQTTFLQTSQLPQTWIKELNIDTMTGDFQKRWTQAFNDYASTDAGHWQKAQTGFTELNTRYPLFKGIQPYLEYTQKQTGAPAPTATSIPAGNTPVVVPTPTPSQTNTQSTISEPLALLQQYWLYGVVALIVLVVAVSSIFGAVKNKSRAKKQQEANIVPITAIAPPGATSGPVERPWPCGHVNRSDARFCSICGEPAPENQEIV